MRRDPRVAVSVPPAGRSVHWTSINGTVVELIEGDEALAHIEALAAATTHEPGHPAEGQVRVIYRIRPDRVRTPVAMRGWATSRSPPGCAPRSFEEFVGQAHLVGPGQGPHRACRRGDLPSMILWGPAGTGKTTLAHLLADAVGARDDPAVRGQRGRGRRPQGDGRRAAAACSGRSCSSTRSTGGRRRSRTCCCRRWRTGTVTLIGATTENPYFSLNTPLLSRCLLLRLEPLAADDLRALIAPRARRRRTAGWAALGLEIDADALDHLVHGGRRRRPDRAHRPRGRGAGGGGGRRGDDHAATSAADAVQKKAIVYDRQGDAHYDVISAFIKSIRGSDPDAALFWLARMLEAGEDAAVHRAAADRARSEDVGHGGHPRAARWRWRPRRRSSTSGCPRPALNLAHATIYLARAPKSNSVYAAIGKALEDAPSSDPVPPAPARRELPGRAAARARQGLQVSARLPGPRGASRSTAPPRSEGAATASRRGWGRTWNRPPARTRRPGKLGHRTTRYGGDPTS